MNGAHDLGGLHGLGPIAPEADEPVFHADWERRAFALTVAMNAAGRWNIDMSRHARERAAPADYLDQTYYQHWLRGLDTLLREQGLASAAEIAAGRAEAPGKPGRVLAPDDVARTLVKGAAARRPETRPARFSPGDRVTTLLINPLGHTRLPRYARGRPGEIAKASGVFVFADTHADGADEADWLYSVRFRARDLWGPEAGARDTIHLDLWERHLEPRDA